MPMVYETGSKRLNLGQHLIVSAGRRRNGAGRAIEREALAYFVR
jgi:hypothetical protein